MSKTTGMTGLTQGLASGTRAGSEGFTSRLEQFRKYAPIQAIDFKQLTDSQKQAKQSEGFMENAFGLKVNPSNTNMYESHFQLAKDKANLLFSDEVLQHYAKDKRGMAEWSSKVDQLNNEISGYEAYYEDSFGDPSKATGKGNTWADHAVRADHPGGEEGFWSDMGVEADRTSGLNDMMKIVDSRQHSSMKFNFETGEFDYEKLVEQDGVPVGIDPFNVNPQSANELFSYNLTQTVFEGPTDYAGKAMFNSVVDSKDQFNERFEKQRTSDSFNRTIADYYIKQHPDEGLSIDEVMQSEDRMDDAFKAFKDQTYDNIKQNERIAKRKAKEARSNTGGGGGSRPAFGGVQETGDEQYPRSVASRIPAEFLVMKDGVAKTVKSQNIFRGEGNSFFIKDKDDEVYEVSRDELLNVLGDAEYMRVTTGLSQGAGGTPVDSKADKNLLNSGKLYDDETWNKATDAWMKDSSILGEGTQKDELIKFEELAQLTENKFASGLVEAYPNVFNITHGDALDEIEDYELSDNAKFNIAERGMGNKIKITNRENPDQPLFIDVNEGTGEDARAIAVKIFKFINNIP